MIRTAEYEAYELNLRLFDADTQTTLLDPIAPQVRTFYHDELIYAAQPRLVHDRFGQKAPIPSGRGKTIEFRKTPPLPIAGKLQEGITPVGNTLEYTTIAVTVDQYGDFTKLSDMLVGIAVDNQVSVAQRRHGDQAGRTLDTVIREVITGGSCKIFSPVVAANGTETEVTTRADITAGSYLTPSILNHAAALLERENATPFEGTWACIVHTDIARDIMDDKEGWIDAHKYADPEAIFRGEIGMLGGIRFFKSTQAKIIGPADMLGIPGYNRTTLNAALTGSTKDVYPVKTFTTEQATAVNAEIAAGKVFKVYVNGVECTVESVTGGPAGTCKMSMTANVAAASVGSVVCGTGAGKDGSAVYCTMVLGQDGYGVTDIEGMGLESIVMPLGSAGSADPLRQRATVGWKATLAAVRLSEQFMVRIEHTSKAFRLQAVSN